MKMYVYKTIMNPRVSISHLVDFSFQITKEKNNVFEKKGRRGEARGGCSPFFE